MENRLMTNIDKEELYDIMHEYILVKDKIENLQVVLDIFTNYYDSIQEDEMCAVVGSVKCQLNDIETQLLKSIESTDMFLLKYKKV